MCLFVCGGTPECPVLWYSSTAGLPLDINLSRSMPPMRVTRSGGPPQSAAVVIPTRTSSKKKRKARQAGTTQRPRSISPGTTADATEIADNAHFLRLSRLAKELRDAAAGHPGAQGPLLDFLKRHWVPQGDDEVPFQSTPTNEHLSDSYDEQDDYIESSKFSEAERVVNQALKFLVGVRSEHTWIRQEFLPAHQEDGALPNERYFLRPLWQGGGARFPGSPG
jgi:hypothetical protein